MKRAVVLLSVILVLALAGCAKEPSADIDGAESALEAARAAEAPDYAPDSWATAKDAGDSLHAELEAQRNASALTRSYSRTQALAVDARTAARKAVEDAEIGKAQAKENAQKTIDQAKVLREEVAKMVEHAPQGKGTTADVAALRADTAGTETSVKDAEDALAAGRYKDAEAKAQAAISALSGIKAQIESAEKSRNAGRRT